MRKLVIAAALLVAANAHGQESPFVISKSDLLTLKNAPVAGGGGGGAPADAQYATCAADATLTNEVVAAAGMCTAWSAGTFALVNVSNAWSAGVKQTFSPNGTNSGFNVGSFAGVPSNLVAGDFYLDTTAITGGVKSKDAQGSIITVGPPGATRFTKFVLFEEFTSYVSASGAVSLGTMRCNTGGTGSGCSNGPATTQDANRPGVWSLLTGTTASAGANVSTMQDFLISGGEVFEAAIDVSLALSTAGSATEVGYVFGLCDTQSTMVCADGIFFYLTGEAAPNVWHIATCRNASCAGTDVASNLTATTGITTWHTLRFEVNSAANSVAFYVDGTALNVSPLASNIPTNAAADRMFLLVKAINGSGNTTTRTSPSLDYVYFTKPVTR